MPQDYIATDKELLDYFNGSDFNPDLLSNVEQERLMRLTEQPKPIQAPDTRSAPAQFLSGAWNQGKDILTGFKDIALAGRDVVRNVAAGHGGATLKGFAQGAAQGVADIKNKPLEFQENFTGVKLAGDQTPWEKGGATATNILTMLIPAAGAAKGLGAAKNAVRSRVTRGSRAAGTIAPEPAAVAPRQASRARVSPERPAAPSPLDQPYPSVLELEQQVLKPTDPNTPEFHQLEAERTAIHPRTQGRLNFNEPEPAVSGIGVVDDFTPSGKTLEELTAELVAKGDIAPRGAPTGSMKLMDTDNPLFDSSVNERDLLNYDPTVYHDTVREMLSPEQIARDVKSPQGMISSDQVKKFEEGTLQADPDRPVELIQGTDGDLMVFDGNHRLNAALNSEKPLGDVRVQRRNDLATLEELRDWQGASRTAKEPRVLKAFEDAGADRPTPDQIREMTGGDTHETPGMVREMELDNAFRRLIEDERGAINFGDAWQGLKEKLGFGKDPEPIMNDPLAMKKGPMDRRQFLYRASGTPVKLARREVGKVGSADGLLNEVDPVAAQKARDLIAEYDRLQNDTVNADPRRLAELEDQINNISIDLDEQMGTLMDGVDPKLNATEAIIDRHRLSDDPRDMFETDDVIRADEIAMEAMDGIPKNHPFHEMVDRYREPYNGLLYPMTRAREAATNTRPGWLKEGIDQVDQSAKSGFMEGYKSRFGQKNANPKTKTTKPERNTILGTVKHFWDDETGAIGRPARGADDTRRSRHFTDEEKEIIRDRKGLLGSWEEQLMDKTGALPKDARAMARSTLDSLPETKAEHMTTRELDLHDPFTGKRGVISELEEMVNKLVQDESGFIDVKKIARAAEQARSASMLSGLALPKSILGNAGSVLTRAAERGTMAPITEALRVPHNVKVAKQAWKNNANPAGIHGSGILNPVGRLMGALDELTTDIHVRSGDTLDDAQRVLLTHPRPLGKGPLARNMQNLIGRVLYPFQRTPFNSLSEGISADNWVTRQPQMNAKGQVTKSGPVEVPESIRKTALSLGTAGAGYLLGHETDDPKLLGLAYALSGPRGLLMAAGAASGAGRKAWSGMTPIPEWGFPSTPEDLKRLAGFEPAFKRAYMGEGSKRSDNKRRTTRRERKERR